MGPKKYGKIISDSKPVKARAQWFFSTPERTGGWTAYHLPENDRIERAYQDGMKIANLGEYVVDTRMFRQHNAKDQSKRRDVKRKLVPLEDLPGAPSTTIGVKGKEVVVVIEDEGEDEVPMKKKGRPESPKKKKAEAAAASPHVRSLASEVQLPTPTPMAPSTQDVPMARTCSGNSSSTATLLEGALPTALIASPPPPSSLPLAVKLSRSTGGKSCVIANGASADDLRLIASVLKDVPEMNRAPLHVVGDVLVKNTRRWLQQIGRPLEESGIFVTIPLPLSDLPPKKRVNMNTNWTTTAAELAATASKAVFTHVGPCPKPLLLQCSDPSLQTSMTSMQHAATQQLAISGPVHVLYDNDYSPIADPLQVVMCSAAGINFAYSPADLARFTEIEDEFSPRTVAKKETVEHMVTVWSHILTCFDKVHRVKHAVLCAIGCGAFKGKFGSLIPRLWATALGIAIQRLSFSHIRNIFISLPTFSGDNNYDPFRVELAKLFGDGGGGKGPAIVIVEDAAMLSIATFLESHKGSSSGGGGPTVGVLNPSDVQALRHGWIGMYWDGGHIALEEALAMQTSLLLHHVGLNKELYTDPARRVQLGG